MNKVIFRAADISKSFPGVKALQHVNLSLNHGSIHALLGENGAGKSTLIKIITGIHRQDHGSLMLDDQLLQLHGPRDAITHGIGVVHQERNLIPRFSVSENIFLESLGNNGQTRIDYRAMHEKARVWLDMLALDVDPATPVNRLSVAQMQLVEIAKALSLKSKVLLLDEPTASLTSHETDTLFSVLHRLRDSGVSLVFVSHKLEEVQEICDQVTVLRDGVNACDSRPMEGLDRQDIVRLMIGRSEQIPDWAARARSTSEVALELHDVCTSSGHRDINLQVRRAEIVGLYGLVGAGRTELAKAILGKDRIVSGSIEVDGSPATISNVADAVEKYHIGYVSEDRKQEGLILMHSIIENVGITVWQQLGKARALLTNRTIREHVEPYINKLEVKTPSLNQYVNNLSGGNQQKVSVAKWLAAGVRVLIIDEPSVGIDIKTKAYLHELIRELADTEDTAILLISSDMPEMITLADRIVVMNDFQVMGDIVNTRDYASMSEAIMNLIHREQPDTPTTPQTTTHPDNRAAL